MSASTSACRSRIDLMDYFDGRDQFATGGADICIWDGGAGKWTEPWYGGYTGGPNSRRLEEMED